ncbi:MATE family efflux transporter [Rhodococcus tibetensis]|uniref:Probable multidrug resistance protein NorM n=1 Tax=Rhodococcus tibetensis TaxID=2965064 RepID=A0ABT1QH21_9NOCA|nr:MATE family efflux transporter [Rhodococcus sp. FXJ9.536]MCQ4121576.1 MATE family efflux transporter [Rhodococcus sp. FXJ9.536]
MTHGSTGTIAPTQSYRQTSRELAYLSAPIALTQLAQVALTTTDTVMMGLISIQALAAGGLAITLFNQLRTMGVGLVTAVGNLVSGAVGRGERAGDTTPSEATADEVRDIVRSSFLIATVAGILGGILLVGLGYGLRFFGQDAEVLDMALPMLIALAPGLVPCLWFQVIRQYTVGMRRPKALLVITILSVLFNITLNWAFIYGTFGLPALGLPGIGVSTSLVYLLTFGIFATMVRRDDALAPMLSLAIHRSRPETVRTILRLGVPIAGTYGSEAGLFSVTAVIIGSFGAPALAAHTVVNQLTYIVFQVSVGISHGSSILVSRFVGLGEALRSRMTARVAFSHAAIVIAVVGLVYLLAPTWVLALFMDTSDTTAVSIATVLLAIAIFQQFADSAQNIGIGLLRGVGDTASSFGITLIGYWLVGLPVSLLFAFGFGLETYGMWIGLSCGLLTAAILLLRTFHQRLRAIETAPAS